MISSREDSSMDGQRKIYRKQEEGLTVETSGKKGNKFRL